MLESVKPILKLQREHGSILKELEEFLKIISEGTIFPGKEKNERLTTIGRKILEVFITQDLNTYVKPALARHDCNKLMPLY